MRPLTPEQPANEAAPPPRQPASTPTRARRRVTREARALLRQADDGGVPMFVSQNLRRIAEANGVDVTEDMTPNAIVEALRARAGAA
jgi:hypothetical protein